jgi:FkbM family methyltransferase
MNCSWNCETKARRKACWINGLWGIGLKCGFYGCKHSSAPADAARVLPSAEWRLPGSVKSMGSLFVYIGLHQEVAMDPVLSPALIRSLEIYRNSPQRDAALDAFYSAFVKPGALVFDIGAHVGDRTACFRRLGARVIALEPQAECAAFLRREAAGAENVIILEAAAGAVCGKDVLYCNSHNPTVNTLSDRFIAAAAGSVGWEGQSWDLRREVAVVTLDSLIAQYGVPDFIKIDIEGHESEALKGLVSVVSNLSFEFTTIQKDVAVQCIDRLHEIGFRQFHASLGESLAFVNDRPLDRNSIVQWIGQLPMEANSGDIYASPAG